MAKQINVLYFDVIAIHSLISHLWTEIFELATSPMCITQYIWMNNGNYYFVLMIHFRIRMWNEQMQSTGEPKVGEKNKRARERERDVVCERRIKSERKWLISFGCAHFLFIFNAKPNCTFDKYTRKLWRNRKRAFGSSFCRCVYTVLARSLYHKESNRPHTYFSNSAQN